MYDMLLIVSMCCEAINVLHSKTVLIGCCGQCSRRTNNVHSTLDKISAAFCGSSSAAAQVNPNYTLGRVVDCKKCCA